MSQTEVDYQDHLTEMLLGPPLIYSIIVLFEDGSTRLFTFSEEDSQLSYVEYLQEDGESLGMVSATMFESTLDFTHTDYEYFNTVH